MVIHFRNVIDIFILMKVSMIVLTAVSAYLFVNCIKLILNNSDHKSSDICVGYSVILTEYKYLSS